MFKRVISSLIISSLLRIDTAFCMMEPEEDNNRSKSPILSRHSLEKPEEGENRHTGSLSHEKKEEETKSIGPSSIHELQQKYEQSQDFKEKIINYQ